MQCGSYVHRTEQDELIETCLTFLSFVKPKYIAFENYEKTATFKVVEQFKQ